MMPSSELKRFRYFGGMPESVLDGIAAISTLRGFRVGDRLLEEAAPAKEMMIVKSGQLDIVYRLGDGREVTAESVGRGDVIGWSALLEPYLLTASVVGAKDGEVIVIAGEPLRQMCEVDAWLGYQLMIEIARGLRDRLGGLRVQLAAAAHL
ncbi:MAG TPA: Crp/Fnr family transcriptional regulator [Anaerolineales bacterium]|nr:Crp/Fnr family transcriptional regulator [Anaerolineales bacterium]